MRHWGLRCWPKVPHLARQSAQIWDQASKHLPVASGRHPDALGRQGCPVGRHGSNLPSLGTPLRSSDPGQVSLFCAPLCLGAHLLGCSLCFPTGPEPCVLAFLRCGAWAVAGVSFADFRLNTTKGWVGAGLLFVLLALAWPVGNKSALQLRAVTDTSSWICSTVFSHLSATRRTGSRLVCNDHCS